MAWPTAETLAGRSGLDVLYLPDAGCYIVQANWPGSAWSIDFAAAGDLVRPIFYDRNSNDWSTC